MSRRPANWYALSNEDKRQWESEAREKDYLESERDEMREGYERAQANERKLEQTYRAEMASAQEQRDALQEEIDFTEGERDDAYEFIRFKNLWEEFTAGRQQKPE